MHLKTKILFVAFFAFVLVSCGNRRGEGERLPKVKDEVLEQTLDSLANQTFGDFYSKLDTEYKDSSRNVSFKVSLRMVRDSAIGATIKVASIPFVNAVITPDSVKMTNRQDKCYTLQSIDFLKESFGVSFTHRNMEELFMGFPIAYSKELEYERVKDPHAYTLTTNLKKDGDSGDELKIYYEFNKELNQLKSTRLVSEADQTEIKIDYKTRQLVDGYALPETVEIVIYTPKQEISVKLEYRKPRMNEPEMIHFVIPDSYEPCK